MYGDARPARRGSPRLASGFLVFALAVTGLCSASELAARAATSTSSGTPPPQAFILVDAGTGSVITARHAHEALPPASIAKIMTALVAVERLPRNALISVTSNAANREAMKIGMQAGVKWPFNQAMAALMMVSANDAAYAVAETVGGSIPGFAAELNATARRYGMRDSTFGDPAGLSDGTSYAGGPKVSAFDLAIAARNALSVPAIARWADTKTYEFTDAQGQHHALDNHNKFLVDNGFGYEGANGFKTGYTEIAQHTLVATAKRNGRECIAVILGSSDSGYTWAASLLDKCWIRPAVEATGTVLPPIAVSPYEGRVAAKTGFTQLAQGRAASLAATSPTTKPATQALAVAVAPTPKPGKAVAAQSPTTETAAHTTKPAGKAHGGLLTPWRLAFLLLVVLAVCFVLRRQAVKRQRARRIERQRARATAMRSGSLPVVDGRYRTGTRVGQPVESRMRVKRSFIDLTREEAPPVRRSRSQGNRNP